MTRGAPQGQAIVSGSHYQFQIEQPGTIQPDQQGFCSGAQKASPVEKQRWAESRHQSYRGGIAIALEITPTKKIKAYAIIVDINGFSQMVRACAVGTIAQDVRDTLAGPIQVVESCGGEVVAFMGDAFLSVIEDDDKLLEACCGIARELDDTCEWISNAQQENPTDWSHMPGGPSLKIAVEYGSLDVSSIQSRFLGQHRLLIGEPINYASRIVRFGEGNRCILGRIAGTRMAQFVAENFLEGPYKETLPGKMHEGQYEYTFLKIGDIWREGPREPGEETYWG